MRGASAKEGNQPIAPKLIDLTAKPVNSFAHDLQYTVHHHDPCLTANFFQDAGRAFNIGNDYGCLAPFTFQGCLGQRHGRTHLGGLF